MRKTIPALLLALALTLSLSACGAAPTQSAAPAAAQTSKEQAPAATPEPTPAPTPAPTPEPTPEPIYIKKERELLVRKTELGVCDPSRGWPKGRVFDKITDYAYDEFGALVSESVSYVHPSARDEYWQGGSYRSVDGRIVEETKTGLLERLETRQVFAYDERGYWTHWTYEWDTVGVAEADFSYDADGRLRFVSISVNGEGVQTMTPVYEDGVQVATKHVSPDGDEVEQRFLYDEQGRLRAIEYDAAEVHDQKDLFCCDRKNKQLRYNDYKAGDRHVEILFAYGENDLITGAEWKVDGKTLDKTRYAYVQRDKETDAFDYEVKGDRGPWLWDHDYGIYWVRSQAYWTRTNGRTDWRRTEQESRLTIVGDRPKYVDAERQSFYETRDVSVPFEPSAGGPASPEDFCPTLAETICGQALPTPDGTKRLIRVRMDDAPLLLVTADLAYRADGSFAGAETFFDGRASYWRYMCEGTTADEQGRVVYNALNDFAYAYAEDGQSYTCSRENAEEWTVMLQDQQIPDGLKQIHDHSDWEFGEDGLPVRRVMHRPGREDYVQEYHYTWTENVRDGDTDTNVNTVLTMDNGFNVLVFDEHGYLRKYAPPCSAAFTYIYEDLA